MKAKTKRKFEFFDVAINIISLIFSVGTVLYGAVKIGIGETWPELVLNLFYIASLVMMLLYFFEARITAMQVNCGCSLCVGATILLRDILFAPPQAIAWIRLTCLTLSVLLLLMLTYFYARREWEAYSKRALWMICIVDTVIAALYHLDLRLEPINEYTDYLLVEIWIRPAITYGLVACFITEKNRGEFLTK